MIRTKEDLKYYLSEDLKRFDGHKPRRKDRSLQNEVWYIYYYIKYLRYVEYEKGKKNLIFLWYFFK